jgi:bifunctional polynucleotide phosphatase/kinase
MSSSAIWEYETDNSKYTRFKPEHSEQVEAAWNVRHQSTSFKIKIGTQTYTIDFKQMQQINDSTKKERALRRKGTDGTLDGRQAFWEWHDQKHNKWTRYFSEQNDEIEKAFAAGKKSVSLSVIVSAHDTVTFTVDLVANEQKNPVSKKTRPIRRVEEVVHRAGAGSAAAASATAVTAVAGTRRARSPEKAAEAKLPTNSAASPLPTVKDFQLLGPNKSCAYLGAEKHRLGGANLASVKVAAFDMDDTIIMPRDGKSVFAKNSDDFKFLCPQVVPKLKELQASNYILVIISNQGGVKDDHAKRTEIMSKICKLNAELGAATPLSALFATHDDEFRKPGTKMWAALEEQLRAEKVLSATGAIDMANSFYCGDAAGRAIATLAGRKKDFSCGDRKFAHNVGIKFVTPEELYLGAKPVADFSWDGLSPDDLKKLEETSKTAKYPASLVRPQGQGQQELIIMCGYAGSGKSSTFRKLFAPANYVWVNRDTLKTPAKCQAAAEEALKNKNSVVIDNTNPSDSDRKPYIDLAKKYGVQARCVKMETSMELAQHLAKYREAFGGQHIPGMVYAIFKKNYVEPSIKEGFAEIISCPLIIDSSSLSPAEKQVLFSLS